MDSLAISEVGKFLTFYLLILLIHAIYMELSMDINVCDIRFHWYYKTAANNFVCLACWLIEVISIYLLLIIQVRIAGRIGSNSLFISRPHGHSTPSSTLDSVLNLVSVTFLYFLCTCNATK